MKRAFVLPGLGYRPEFPLLWFSRALLSARGYEERLLWSEFPPEVTARTEWIHSRAVEAFDEAPGAHIILAKSIGTLAMPVAAEKGLPGIWLTPLLNNATVADALGDLRAPTLLVGGTADSTWDGALARKFGHEVIEIPDADHGLEVAGDPVRSVEALLPVIRGIDSFVEHL